MRITALICATLLFACGNTSTSPVVTTDGGSDAGLSSDASVSVDAGSLECDAGCLHLGLDAGVDAGMVDDSHGGSADAGTCSGQTGDHLRTLYFGGVLRAWYEHVPGSYDCAHPSALVLDFHGYSSNAVEEMALTRFNAKADAVGFIAVHAEGLGAVESWNAGACCGTAALLGSDDVGFVRAMVANIAQRYAIDPKRIYATGMSNGGFLSHRLGCEAADLIAAIAPVAGVMGIASCHPSRAVPVLDFHGTSDLVVSYTGQSLAGFNSVDTTMSGWASRNGCGTTKTTVFSHGDATCQRWDGCPTGVEVQLCTITDGGHTWPGGLPVPTLGKTSTDVSATDRAWEFFASHPMP